MNKFVRSLITEWRKLELPFTAVAIVVAVSGGADSVSLILALHELFQMKKLKLDFVVAHFNHNLRGAESDKDAEFVEHLAGKLNFEFIGEKGGSKLQNQKGNLEELARNARYEFLAQTAIAKNSKIVLTAHTLNDRAETFLLNLLRGSGIEGMSAMKPKRSLESGIWNPALAESADSDKKSAIGNPQSAIELVRPFLSWAKREETENFCREKKIEFRQDAMNDDKKFARVRIRKELIPLLKTFNPKIVETLAQTSQILLAETESLSVIKPQFTANLALVELKKLPKSLRRRLLRQWLESRRGSLRSIGLKHIEAIEQLVFSPKSGRIAELPNGGMVIKKGGKLFFEWVKVEKSRGAN